MANHGREADNWWDQAGSWWTRSGDDTEDWDWDAEEWQHAYWGDRGAPAHEPAAEEHADDGRRGARASSADDGRTGARASSAPANPASRRPKAKPKSKSKPKAKATAAAAVPNSQDRREYERWKSDHRSMLIEPRKTCGEQRSRWRPPRAKCGLWR